MCESSILKSKRVPMLTYYGNTISISKGLFLIKMQTRQTSSGVLLALKACYSTGQYSIIC